MLRPSLTASAVAFVLLASTTEGCGGGGGSSAGVAAGSSPAPVSTHDFSQPDTCARCHPLQTREWQGSVMHYGAMSPVFNAFELTMEKLSQGALAPNGANPGFCVQCHAPTAVLSRENPDYVDAASARPVRESFSEVSKDGLSCDVCHSVSGADPGRSLLGDGIANLSLLFSPGSLEQGPLRDPLPNQAHDSIGNDFFTSPRLCGGCHDVRIPKPDPITGEPFQRLENLFTEWEQGPYASGQNPFGRVVTCQDCHMSRFPETEPGVYPQVPVAVNPDGGPDPAPRRHALHAFTAVSKPLIDDPRFPNVDTAAVDSFGYPLGQEQRRRQMLRAACELTLDGTPASLPAGSQVIPIQAVVTNVGAGHRVPAGFSQERQVWLEIVVRDDRGVIYESGVLHDKAHPETGEMQPDGRVDDEDLEDQHFTIDDDTFDTQVAPGPDADQRPQGVNLGLVNFQNRFVRIRPDGSWETVLNPLRTDHMDNGHSLEMLTPRRVAWDVPVPARGLSGAVRVRVRLRYRAFPPELLRFLARREPALVNEAIVDRNTIVDMAEARTTIER